MLRRRRYGPAIMVLGLVLTVLVGVAVASNPAASTSYRATPMDTTHAAPSAGCGQAPELQPGRTTTRLIPVGNRQRSYRVHVPRRYSAGKPLPLIIAFHGHRRSGALLEESSHLSRLPAIVAYPNGLRDKYGIRAWQGAPYAARGADDLAFTSSLLRSLESSACVDLHRVYTVGHSNGGEFATMAACRLGSEIAGTAVVSGAFYDRTVPCDRPIAMLELHGTADGLIPYAGAHVDGVRVPRIPRLMGAQARVNGCAPAGTSRRMDTEVSRVTYTGCGDGRTVERVRISGAGHRWPERTIAGIPAYGWIWSFFADLPNADLPDDDGADA